MKEEISNEELYNIIVNVADEIKGRRGIGTVSIAYLMGEPKTKAMLTTGYNRDALTFIIRSIAQKDEYRDELVKIKDIIEEALEE